jgi:prepilin-type N-terminal cleavage/methylation domain-containing protein
MRQPRQAFTLIEMMVATALVLFVMVLLSQAFVAGMEVFRQLKGIGDMDERLRSTAVVLRRDLAADHFTGRKRLSELNLAPPPNGEGPPAQGFVRVWQGSPTPASIPVDGDGLPCRTATDHALHFTVRLLGNRRPDYFLADISSDAAAYTGTGWALVGTPDGRYQVPGTYTSQWIELAYFLRPNGTTANGTALYTLYRRQRLASPDNTDMNYSPARMRPIAALSTPSTAIAYTDISYTQPTGATANIYFNSPSDLTIPQRRFGMEPSTPGGDGGIPQGDPPLVPVGNYPILADRSLLTAPPSYLYTAVTGADVLLSDVISFEVQILYPESGVNAFVDVPSSRTSGLNNSLFNDSNTTWHAFDTWSSNNDRDPATSTGYDYSSWYQPGSAKSIPLTIHVHAIKVTVRVWDHKTQQSRQITIMQDM